MNFGPYELFVQLSLSIGWIAIPLGISVLLLVAILLLLNLKSIIRRITGYGQITAILLFFLIIFSLFVRIYLPDTAHKSLDDEHYHMIAGTHILTDLTTGPEYFRPIGWPLLISISFAIFGISSMAAIYTSILMGALTIGLAFLIFIEISKKKLASFFAALSLSLFPELIRQSASAEANTASLFFILASFLVLIWYLDNNQEFEKPGLLPLVLCMTAFTAMIRPENTLFLLLVPTIITIQGFRTKRRIEFSLIVGFLLMIILCVPNFVNFMSIELTPGLIERESRGTLQGDAFSFHNFWINARQYGEYLVSPTIQPILFTAVAIIGLVSGVSRRNKWFIYTSIWFVLLWIGYFSSYFQVVGVSLRISSKMRFFMMTYPLLSLWMAEGLGFLSESIKRLFNRRWLYPATTTALGILVVISFIPYTATATGGMELFRIITHANDYALQTVPEGCSIITNRGYYLIGLDGYEVISRKGFLTNPSIKEALEGQCAVFMSSIDCIEAYLPDQEDLDFCEKISSEYNLSLIAEYGEEESYLSFYNLTLE